MRFRNSLRLLTENFKNVYRILLYKLIIGVVALALSSALLLPRLNDILQSAEMAQIWSDLKSFVFAIIDGNSAFLQGFREHFAETVSAFVLLIKANLSKLVWSLVGCAFVYLVERFLDTLCYFTIGGLINDKMATYAETPFASSFIKNLGKASIYSLVYVPIVFLFDLLVVVACYFFFFYLFALAGLNLFFSLFFSALAIVLCQSLKLTMTSMWLPAMAADNMTIGQAMRFGDKQQRKQWKKVFSTYVVSVYLVIIVNVLAALCTFGSALLLTIPASFFLFICLQFVNYYTVQGKKYFITYEKIATNLDHGDSERFFATVESEEDTHTAEQDLAEAREAAERLNEKLERAEELEKKLDEFANSDNDVSDGIE